MAAECVSPHPTFMDSVHTPDEQEVPEDKVIMRSEDPPPEPSMFDAEDFGEFSQDFAWESSMAVIKFLLAALATVGITFVFYYFDAHFLLPVMMFGFFILALSYSLLRSNNRVRINCDFFGFLVSVVFQIPGWYVTARHCVLISRPQG